MKKIAVAVCAFLALSTAQAETIIESCEISDLGFIEQTLLNNEISLGAELAGDVLFTLANVAGSCDSVHREDVTTLPGHKHYEYRVKAEAKTYMVVILNNDYTQAKKVYIQVAY